MSITGWSIDGCGHLRGVEVTGLGPGLSVVLGPNESGKTTTLQFLRWTMFGYPTRRDARVKRLDPQPAPFGGRIHLLHRGRELTAERYFGDEHPSLTHADGSPAALPWSDVVGAATRELFEHVFAITTDELQEFGALDSSGIREQIYAASTVGGGASAREILGRLDDERRALLTTRSGQIREVLRSLKEADVELRRARSEAAAIESQRAELTALAEALDSSFARQQEVAAERDRLDALLDCWSDWVAVRAAREELASLPTPVPLPPDPLVTLDRAEERCETHRRALDDAELAVHTRRRAIDDIELDDRLDAAGAEIRRLQDQRLAIDSARDELQRLLREAPTQRERLQRRIADLHRDATPESLRATVTDPAALQAVATTGGAVSAARDAAADARAAADRAEVECHDAARELAEQTERRDHLLARLHLGSDHHRALDAARQLQSLVPIAAAADVDRPGDDDRSTGADAPVAQIVRLLWGLIVVTLLGSGVGFAAGQPVMGGALAVVGVLLVGVAVATPRRRATMDSPSTAPRSERDNRLTDAAVAAGFTARPTIEQVNDRIRELEQVRSLDDHLLALRQRRDRADDDHATTAAAAAAADAALDSASLAWRELAERLAIPRSVGPDGATAFLQVVQGLQESLEQLHEDEQRMNELRTRIDEYDRECGDALRTAGRTPPSDPAELATAMVTLREDLDALDERTRRREHLTEGLPELEGAATSAAARLDDADAALAKLIADAGVEDPTAYRSAAQHADRRAELEAVVNAFDTMLSTRFGGDDAVKEARLALEHGDITGWRQRRDELESVTDAARTDHENAIREHQTATAAVEALESSADVPRLALRVAERRDELQELIADWLVDSLAERAIDDTLRMFERERQPEVVQTAGQAFERITDGRYAGLVPGAGSIEVRRPNGSKLPAESLSRGATEQLYLALRLALAQQYATTTPLPLILDDVLVNADPARQVAIAEELHRVAASLQVIVFTCHESTAGLLSEGRPDTPTIELP